METTLYKSTTLDNYTDKYEPNCRHWGNGITHSASAGGKRMIPDRHAPPWEHPLIEVLCGPPDRYEFDDDYMDNGMSRYIEAYTDPLIAMLLEPHPVRDRAIWTAHGVVALTGLGGHVGCTSLTTIDRIDVPQITLEQRVRFGVYCEEASGYDPKTSDDYGKSFSRRSRDWLAGKGWPGQANEAIILTQVEALARTSAWYASRKNISFSMIDCALRAMEA